MSTVDWWALESPQQRADPSQGNISVSATGNGQEEQAVRREEDQGEEEEGVSSRDQHPEPTGAEPTRSTLAPSHFCTFYNSCFKGPMTATGVSVSSRFKQFWKSISHKWAGPTRYVLDRSPIIYQPTQWTVANAAHLSVTDLGGHAHLWCHKCQIFTLPPGGRSWDLW